MPNKCFDCHEGKKKRLVETEAGEPEIIEEDCDTCDGEGYYETK